MENIKSFDCMPSPTMKAMMENFSSGMYTFNDSALTSRHRTSGSPMGSALWSASDSSASCTSKLQ